MQLMYCSSGWQQITSSLSLLPKKASMMGKKHRMMPWFCMTSEGAQQSFLSVLVVLCLCAKGTSLRSWAGLLRCILARWLLMCLHTWTEGFWYTWGEILTRIPFLNIIQDFQNLIAWVCLVGKYQSWWVDVWKWKGFKPSSRSSTAKKP